MEINPANLATFTRTVTAKYNLGAQAQAEKSFYRELADRVTGVGEIDMGWVTQIEGLVEMIGEPAVTDLSAQSWTIRAREFAREVHVKHIDLKRDKYGIYGKIFNALGIKAGQHPDKLLAALIEAGFSQACYTGSPYFSASHKLDKASKDSPTLNNLGDRMLTADSFNEAVESMLSILDAAGDPVNLASDLTLLVPVALRTQARNILLPDLVNGGDSNLNKGEAKLMVNPWLRNPNRWYLFNTGGAVKPFAYYEEIPTRVLRDPGTYSLVEKYKAYGVHSMAYLAPHLAWGSTGAEE